MTTTIELPDDLVREAETKGALAGLSLEEMLAEGLRLVLASPKPAPSLQGRASAARPDITAWERLGTAYEDPFPGLSSMQMLDEFRGPVEIPPVRP